MRTSRRLWTWLLTVFLSGAGTSGFAQEKTELLKSIPFPDSRLAVSGLPWFNEDKPEIFRLPKRLKPTFRKEVWDLARNASGGRIRFATDSEKLSLKAQCDDASVMYHITSIGQNGFDLYVNGLYRGSAAPKEGDTKIGQVWDLGKKGEPKEITLYMPLYKGVSIQGIGLDQGASLHPPAPFRLRGPVVYYGTSITQGGCASNPGMSYPAILSRRLNLDFVNLGFSGNGRGDESVAKAMAGVKASAYVLDYWANVSAEELKKTLPTFVRTLRKAAPRTPILILGPYVTTYGFNEEEKQVAEEFVTAQRKAGDKNISFVDGRTMITEETAYGLVDGIHCSTLGFQMMADALEGPLKVSLGFEK